MSEMKPCPACRNEKPMVLDMSKMMPKGFSVECGNCWFYSNKSFATRQEAIDYWNSGADAGYICVDEEVYHEV